MHLTIIHFAGLQVVEGDPCHEDRGGCRELFGPTCSQGAEYTHGLKRERVEEVPRLCGLDKG